MDDGLCNETKDERAADLKTLGFEPGTYSGLKSKARPYAPREMKWLDFDKYWPGVRVGVEVPDNRLRNKFFDWL